MRSKTGFKTGIYFSHYECFGHTSRVMAVGEVIKKKFPQGGFFFVQAGAPQPKARIGREGRVYPLPGSGVEKRSQICGSIVTREKPDLFITEFFPLGFEACRHELIPSLLKLSVQGTPLWAVAGYPLLTGTNHEWRHTILKLYKKVIIFSPPDEKERIAATFTRGQDRRRYLDFFEENASKIKFAGYLLPKQEVVHDDGDQSIPKPPAAKGVCRVAVLRGGGSVYPKMIAQAIRASDILGKEYYLTVAAGPSTTSEEWDLFTALVKKKKIDNLALLRSVGDYEGLIKSSDVCVSMAGYNTSVMLLKHRKKTVLIPFEGHGSMSIHEQPARASLLKEMIGAQVLFIRDLTASALASAVKETASRKVISTDVPKKWFTGSDILAKELTGLSGR